MSDQFQEALIKAFELIWTRDPEVIAITKLSFMISFNAVILACVFAIPLGFIISLNQFPGKGVIVTLSNTFTGFPPVVMGVFLYLLFSRDAPLGFLGLLYTPQAMVIAQFLLSFPIVLSGAIQAFDSISDKLLETLKTTSNTTLENGVIMFYEIREILIGGIVFAFGRAISEVGAIIIVGGNIRWKTRTLTTAAVLEVSQGRPEVALALGIILLTASILVNLAFRYLQTENNSAQVPWKRSNHGKPGNQSSFRHELIQEFKNAFKTQESFSIQVKDFEKKYQEKVIIKKSNFSIPNNKITLLLGANGSGKTTILRCLSGLDTKFMGEVAVSRNTPVIPFIHQKPLLFKTKTKHNLLAHSLEENNRKKILIDLFELNELLDQESRKLSGGESRLVALARTLIPNPGVLFLDEVTADLDPINIAKIERTLILLKEIGYTIILASHNIQQAKRLADHLLFIDDSQVIESDNPEAFFNEPPNKKIKNYLEGVIPW